MEGRKKERKKHRQIEDKAVDTHQEHENSKISDLSNKSTP